MTAPIVVMTGEELAALVRLAVSEALAEFTPAPAAATLSPTTYYSVPEFAALLNVCPDTIYKDVRDGRITHTRVGRQIRIPENALATYQQGGAA
ncbi:DUF3853 family protein [Deinococcus humi]|uniref:Excisionase family DNA binding protein n=1 Tax=Deinococcus humi TaxID=662880 RepID=A0A7W8JYD8_9DEIO|nr:DUF3853 family protein [Deinococcus humi]MBB5364031.1 excisionase family DNA binding protein [Deinococcus humi]GGO32606.1 hypothetical protein GCM10008949_30390 [Deinococcus humi]